MIIYKENHVSVFFEGGGPSESLANKFCETHKLDKNMYDKLITLLDQQIAGVLPKIMEEEGCVADMLLADLGFASTQIDDPERGFSILHDGPLDMRYDQTRGQSAAALLQETDEEELADWLAHTIPESSAHAQGSRYGHAQLRRLCICATRASDGALPQPTSPCHRTSTSIDTVH